VYAAIRFRRSRLRFFPSHDRLDHGRCRFCLDGGAVIPGAENGFHLLFECTYLPSSLLCRRTTLLDAIAVDLWLNPCTSRRRQAQLHMLMGDFRLPSSSFLRLLLVYLRDLINFYASFKTPKEPLDLQARRVCQCRPRFRNGSMPSPDPLVDNRPLVSPLDV